MCISFPLLNKNLPHTSLFISTLTISQLCRSEVQAVHCGVLINLKSRGVGWVTFSFGTWIPFPSTSRCGRIRFLDEFLKQATLKCYASRKFCETNL